MSDDSKAVVRAVVTAEREFLHGEELPILLKVESGPGMVVLVYLSSDDARRLGASLIEEAGPQCAHEWITPAEGDLPDDGLPAPGECCGICGEGR